MHYPDHYYETTPQPLLVREKGVPSGDIEIRRLTYREFVAPMQPNTLKVLI